MIIYGARGERSEERVLARRLLELAAAEQWGLSSLPPLERLPGGKPRFAGLEGREFNFSHSGGVVLCALDGSPVGMDVQTLRVGRPALLRRALSQKERDWLEGREDPAAAFTALWALKESLVKRSGRGLDLGQLASLSIPLPQGGDGPWLLEGLWFRLYRGEDWIGSACGVDRPPEQILWRKPENLT